jgi:NitT/TauT family transport system substrate-binding protein
MEASMQIKHNRRRILAGLSTAAAGLVCAPRALRAEPPPETATVRFVDFPGGTCTAPQYVAEGLLRGEGFNDFRYVPLGAKNTGCAVIADGEADFALDFASALVAAVDVGMPVKGLSGIHVGCYELFAHEGVNSILDLKGKSVGVGPALGSDPHLFVAAMATHVGLDPARDINWIVSDIAPMQLFAERKIDALLGVAGDVQELRERKLGHAVVSGTFDRPWSQYFCCMLIARTDYFRRYPIATKRVLRAVLKGADVCVSNPAMVARLLVDGGYSDNYDYAARMLAEIPYGKWREFDPEDSVRFFALRLHEAGLVKSNPQKIIETGTDWRFLDEVKRELKT